MSGFPKALPRLAPQARGLGDGLAALFDRVYAWHAVRRERETLAGLDEHMLKDVGLTRADVARETSKSFWRD